MTRSTVGFVSISSYGYFNPNSEIDYGGTQRQMYHLSTAISAHFDVHVVVGDYGQPKVEVVDGVTLHRAYPVRGPDRSIITNLQDFHSLFDAMRNINADVFIHNGLPRNASVCYFIAQVLRSNWIYHIASDANIVDRPAKLSRPLKILFRKNLVHSDLIIAQTELQQRQLMENWGLESTIVPNGYPCASDKIPHSKREYVLWIGRICKNPKQPHVFLQLAEALPHIDFIMIGPLGSNPSYNEYIMKSATSLDNVDYIGPVSPNRVHEFFKRAKVFVNTSEYEGFPNTFLEAWRYATPVVGYAVDPNRFIEQDLRLYANESSENLINIVDQLATDNLFRKDIGDDALRQFEKSYDIKNVAEMYTECIECVI